jgi:hypothetical protein
MPLIDRKALQRKAARSSTALCGFSAVGAGARSRHYLKPADPEVPSPANAQNG